LLRSSETVKQGNPAKDDKEVCSELNRNSIICAVLGSI
jgi:hypothetical protein